MHIERKIITPEMARTWLLVNGSNRTIRARHVDMLAREIRDGRWQLTHQGIAFDIDGAIIDGQHRLSAIVAADSPVEMMIAYNVPRNAIGGVDAGANRSFMDRCHFDGASYSKAQAAMVRILVFGPDDTATHSYGEIAELIEEHRDALMFARPTATGGNKPAAAYAVIARAWYTQDRDRLAAFKEVFQSGSATGPEDWAALRLRDQCVANRVGGRKSRIEVYWRAESACLLFLNRRPITRLYAAPEELFPMSWEEDKGNKARRNILYYNMRHATRAEQVSP